MGKFKVSKDYGIHTIELYANNLKYPETQRAIEFLADHGKVYTTKSDTYNIDRHLNSTCLVVDGIRLRTYQSHNKSNGIGFIINPSTLLSNKYQPVKLWIPTEEAVEALLKYLDGTLKALGVSSMRAKDLSLSQMDLTQNIWYPKGCDLTSRIYCYHKCFIPRNFKVIESKDKETRQHLFVMKNGTVTVKAYDKVYELKANARCPESLRDESILRFEISMKREAFLKRLGLDRKDSLYEMLLAGCDHGMKILNDYDNKMFPFSSDFVRYEKARKLIESKISDSLMKEQMLYLLKKTSDSAGLSTAVRKLKEYYKNVDDRRIKRIYAEFDRLGIAPITLPSK